MITSRTLRAALLAAFMGLGAIFAQAQSTQTWLMLRESSQETFFVTDRAEQDRLLKTGWKVGGTGYLLAQQKAGSVGMIRFAKGFSGGGDRIFAISPAQEAEATKAGYAREGLMGQVSTTQATQDMIPVYHFTKDSHNLWLIDKADQKWAEKSGWKSQGVAFWIWSKASS